MSEKIKVRDAMGEMEVPEWAYFGASTQRAILNFPISGEPVPWEIIEALITIKIAAAQTNAELGLITPEVADAITLAGGEFLEKKETRQFPVDIYQTGSGTSTNMNVNEVLAARANEILGHPRWGKHPVHPNDHVNRCQSSNDVFPSALHISAILLSEKRLIPALEKLKDSLSKKSEELSRVVKVGRTHWQDAVPVTLGQEFSAYSTQIDKHLERLRATFPYLEELPLGGTAVGTGINCHPEFGEKCIEKISEATGILFKTARNRFEELGSKDALTGLSKSLSALATSLMKIASDIRFLSCGPKCGIAEIRIPALQPGSSIMPGKVNPVIPESVLQVAARVIGNDVTISIANSSGHLELNVMMPLIGKAIIESLTLLSNASLSLAEKCVDGIEADKERCTELVDRSLALVTPLAVRIGYDKAAEIAKEAFETGKTIRQLVIEKGLLSEEEANEVLDPEKMV